MPLRLGRFRMATEVALVVALLALMGLARCGAYREGGDDARLATLEANAHKASMAGIASRARADSVTRLVTTRIASNRQVGARLDERLAANDSILSAYALMDGANDTTQTLIIALQRTTEVARVYRDSTDVLLDAVGSLIVAHEAERAANAAHVAAQRAVIAALKDRECRVLFVKCPSRRTAFAAGVVTTLGVIVAVAR